MFKKLQNRWKVNAWQLAIIIIVFALGGSLCGYLSKLVLALFEIDGMALRVPIYILLITLLWPVCVIMISIPFGQFPFFLNYLKRVFRRMGGLRRNEK